MTKKQPWILFPIFLSIWQRNDPDIVKPIFLTSEWDKKVCFPPLAHLCLRMLHLWDHWKNYLNILLRPSRNQLTEGGSLPDLHETGGAKFCGKQRPSWNCPSQHPLCLDWVMWLSSGEQKVSGGDEHHLHHLWKPLCRIVRFSKQEYGMPNKFELSENYIPHTYTKKWFTVYLKIKYNWASCIVSGSPVFMQDHLSLLLMVVPRQISKPHWICKILPSVWAPDLLWEVELSSCHTLHCNVSQKTYSYCVQSWRIQHLSLLV